MGRELLEQEEQTIQGEEQTIQGEERARLGVTTHICTLGLGDNVTPEESCSPPLERTTDMETVDMKQNRLIGRRTTLEHVRQAHVQRMGLLVHKCTKFIPIKV